MSKYLLFQAREYLERCLNYSNEMQSEQSQKSEKPKGLELRLKVNYVKIELVRKDEK